MNLRDYQLEMLDRIEETWSKVRSVMVQMPTGTGKTVLMAELIRRKMQEGVLIVAHRIEIITQISETLDKFGVAHGVIGRDVKDAEAVMAENQVVVASIQTLARRGAQIKTQPGLVIVDEAHHALAKSYRWMWNVFPKAKFLGMTATPCRMTEDGFRDLFDRLLQSWDIQQFIDEGYLSDFEYVSVSPDSMMVDMVRSLKKRGADGDYQQKEMAAVMDCEESTQHLYESYHHYCLGKKGLIYAIDRQHAHHIAEYYRKQGVGCCVIDAQTPKSEREKLVDEYRQGIVDVIVNVDIFSEGFDCPEVEFIQLARPTLSLAKYLQQVGRGMRVTKGKDCVTILDQVGLYQTFGLPTDDREWDLMFRGKLSGKGQQGMERGYIIHRDNEKTLVNLDMVRIKRRGETSTGVEVFLKNGRYGILKDGKVSCPPEFETIKWLEAPYFVMGIYPYLAYHSKTTVVDESGKDLKASLYGSVKQDGDVFQAEDVKGQTIYWDAKGGRSYRRKPEFSRIQRYEIAKEGQQYHLRNGIKGWEKAFSKDNVFVSDHMVIMGNILICQNNPKKTYRICGFRNKEVVVECRDVPGYSYAVIKRQGKISNYTSYLPKDLEKYPDFNNLGLKRFF